MVRSIGVNFCIKRVGEVAIKVEFKSASCTFGGDRGEEVVGPVRRWNRWGSSNVGNVRKEAVEML